MKSQNGYTLVELLGSIVGLAVLALIGFVLYAAIHFLLKFW